jgi:hypothetical protein
VRVVGADDPHVQLMREGNIAGKAAAADHQGRVFQTLDRSSDPLLTVFAHAPGFSVPGAI